MHYTSNCLFNIFLLSFFLQVSIVSLQKTSENVNNDLYGSTTKNEIPENLSETSIEAPEISISRTINETSSDSNNVISTEVPIIGLKMTTKSSKLTTKSKMSNLTTNKIQQTTPFITTSVTKQKIKKRKTTKLTTTTPTMPPMTKKRFNKEIWLQMKQDKKKMRIKTTTGKPTTTKSKIVPTTAQMHKLFNFMKLSLITTTCTTTISPLKNATNYYGSLAGNSENFGTKNSTIANGSLDGDKTDSTENGQSDENAKSDENYLKNKYLLKATKSPLGRKFGKFVTIITSTTTTTAVPTIATSVSGMINFPKAYESCGSKKCDNSKGFICVVYDLPCLMREEKCTNYEDSSECLDSNNCENFPCDPGLQCMMLKSPCDFRAHHLRGCPPMKACIDPEKSQYCGSQRCQMRHGQICEIQKITTCLNPPCPDLQICRDMIDIRSRKRSA